MLLYKNHRFHCEGVSFAIPDGYRLDTSYEEVPEDTLHLWSEDESLHICVGIERETKGPYQELVFILRALEKCIVKEKPTEVIYGGLRGYSAVYSSGGNESWEAHLGISGIGDDQTGLIMLITAQGKLPNKEDIQVIIEGISPCRE